jgi:hypothetical protein
MIRVWMLGHPHPTLPRRNQELPPLGGDYAVEIVVLLISARALAVLGGS